MKFKFFISEQLQENRNDPKTSDIIKQFKSYKSNNDAGTLFGRDVLTERPYDAKDNELYHVHLLEEKNIKRLYLRDKYNRTSDTFLFYCSGLYNQNYYLLIAIVWNGAHEFLNNKMDLLIRYGKEAEKFRNIY